jgi:hypothetical protein
VIADNPYALGRCAVQLLAEFHHASPMRLPAPGRASLHLPSIIVNEHNVRPYRSRQGTGWTSAGIADVRL